MGRRIDWWDDPAAPPINSVKPSAAAYVLDESGTKVLLICRDDNGNWSMPGGAMDPGESLAGCAVRETREEAGVEIEVTGVGGIWTDPRHRLEYTSDGEVRQEFTVVYKARVVGGQPTPSKESVRVEWVPLTVLDDLPMDRSQRLRLEWMRRGDGVYFDPA